MHERGVRWFSISDHDTLAAYAQIDVPQTMRLVRGVEINTTYDDGEVHVLGYGMAADDRPFDALLQRNRDARRIRVGKIVEQLQRSGYAISMDEVQAQAKQGAALGRPHVGKALIQLGITGDIESAFRDFLRRGAPGYVPSTHITPHEAIDAIASAGGIAVLAHPGRLKNHGIVGELVERGLAGLEVFYPRHDAAQTQHFRDMARRYRLVMSAGADFHDIRYNRRGVGMEVDEADIRPFLERFS